MDRTERFRKSAGAVALAVGGAVAADAPLQLRYGADAAFAPFEWLDEQGRPQGFQVELLAQLGELTGIAFDVRAQPWPRTEADFRAGALDVVAMVDTEPRRAWALFARAHATPTLGVFQRRDEAPVQALHDLRGRRLVVTSGEAMRDTLAHDLPGLPEPVLRVADAAAALAAVSDGRADLAVLPRAYADPLLAQGRAPGVVAAGLSLAVQSYAFALAPGREALRDRLQRGLDELERTGRLEALRTRWLDGRGAEAERVALRERAPVGPAWAWAGAGGACAAVLGVALWRRQRRLVAERERRARLEHELRRADALLDQAFTRHADPMLLVERGSRIVRDANPALSDLLGRPLAELVGRSLDDLAAHLDPGVRRTLTGMLDETGVLEAVPLKLSDAQGRPIDVLVSGESMRIDGVEHGFCLLRDVTAQLAHDRELQRRFDESAARLTVQVESARSEARAARDDAESARRDRALAEQRLAEVARVVSHDLKPPLAAVTRFAGLLGSRLRQGRVDEAKAFGEQIERAARRMDATIGALVGLVRVGRQPLQRQAVDMRQMAQDAVAALQVAPWAKRVEVRIDPIPEARGDPALLAQAWQSLLGHAITASARTAEPKVRVDSHGEGATTWYRVTDNGTGTDPEPDSAEGPFRSFLRDVPGDGPGDGLVEEPGAGLGLVRRIVARHGGTLRVRSAPGVGTVAEFTLPT